MADRREPTKEEVARGTADYVDEKVGEVPEEDAGVCRERELDEARITPRRGKDTR